MIGQSYFISIQCIYMIIHNTTLIIVVYIVYFLGGWVSRYNNNHRCTLKSYATIGMYTYTDAEETASYQYLCPTYLH